MIIRGNPLAKIFVNISDQYAVYIICCFLMYGTFFVQAQRIRIYDEKDNLVREERTQDRRNGNIQTHHRLIQHYRDGVVTHSDDYLRTIESLTGYYLREEIFARIDQKGNRVVNRIRRYKETKKPLPDGEEIQKLNEDLDGNNNYRSYQLQVERNTQHVNQDGRRVQVYERLRFDRDDNQNHHYKRSTMNYENPQGININQVVENNYSAEGYMQDMKVTRRYTVEIVQHVKIEHTHFDGNGNISRRSIVESERWRENPQRWEDVKITRNYEGKNNFLNETREEKTTISTDEIFHETERTVRMDKNRTVVQESKNEKVVERRPLSGQDQGTRTVTIQNTFDGQGRQLSQQKRVEENLERHLANGTEKIYRLEILDENENSVEKREDKEIRYHSGELQSVDERRHVRGARLLHHWRKDIRLSGTRRIETLKNYDIHRNQTSQTRTVQESL